MFSFLFYRGALTSKPYSFIARSWEFKSINTFDFFDSFGSSIRVDTRGDKIIRILPRLNDCTNEEWISDKIRFCSDGLRLQRIDIPLIRFASTKFKSISWFKILSFLFKMLISCNQNSKKSIFSSYKYVPIRFFDGVFSNLNSALSLNFAISTLIPKFINSSCLKLQSNLNKRQFFTSNFPLRDLSTFDFLIFCGFNVRYESPIFNIRVRYNVVKKNLIAFNFGSNFISSFTLNFLGGVSTFVNFLNNKHWVCSNFIKKKVFVIFNNFFTKNVYFSPIERELARKNIAYGVISRYSSTVQNSEVGNIFCNYSAMSNLFGCNIFFGLPSLLEHAANNLLINNRFQYTTNFIFAHHGDIRLKKLDAIIPNAAVFEQDSNLITCEGLVQPLRTILSPPKNVLDVSEIINLLFGLTLRQHILSLSQLNFFFSIFFSSVLDKQAIWVFVNNFFLIVFANKTLEKKIPISLLLKEFLLVSLNYLESATLLDSFDLVAKSNFIQKNLIVNRSVSPLFKPIENFYLQDEISSSSLSLVSASERLTNKKTYV